MDQPWLRAIFRYTSGSNEASITTASVSEPMRYDKHPLPTRRIWITVALLAGSGMSAVFQDKLQACIPPSSERASMPRACSCLDAIWLVYPELQTVTTGTSEGRDTPSKA